jgi:hypothetical protein
MANATAYRAFAEWRDRWSRFLADRRSRNELAALPPDELRAIAQDIGVSEPELRSLRCDHPGPGELMPERMRRLGLDPEFVAHAHPATYRDMEKTCAACGSWRRCARDLDKGDVQAGMEGYCGNALTIDALLVGRRGAA